MKTYAITFLPENTTVQAAPGKSVLEAAAAAGISVNSVCGGDGVCGKCRVIIKSGKVTAKPNMFLDRREIQRGMALATKTVLENFPVENRVFINLLMNISIFCDCWGMTTASLVPDIGILAGRDIVAIEQATLDFIHTENLIAGALPPKWKLGREGHLFERVHGKDPHAVIEFLEEFGLGKRKYQVREIE